MCFLVPFLMQSEACCMSQSLGRIPWTLRYRSWSETFGEQPAENKTKTTSLSVMISVHSTVCVCVCVPVASMLNILVRLAPAAVLILSHIASTISQKIKKNKQKDGSIKTQRKKEVQSQLHPSTHLLPQNSPINNPVRPHYFLCPKQVGESSLKPLQKFILFFFASFFCIFPLMKESDRSFAVWADRTVVGTEGLFVPLMRRWKGWFLNLDF